MSDNPIGEVIEASATGFCAQCLEVPRQMVSRLYDPPPFGSFVKIGRNGPHPGFATPLPSEQERGQTQDPVRLRTDAGETEAGGDIYKPFPRSDGGEVPKAERGLPADEGLFPSDDEPDPFASVPLDRAAAARREETPSTLARATYALVSGASTTSLEAGRRPSALGFADEDELRQQQPQIFELLRTEFTGMLVAYSDGQTLRRHLPPKPPRVHSRVYECTAAEVRTLTQDLSFLRGLLNASGGDVPPDELVAALLRQARDAHTEHGQERDFLLRAGKILAALLADDYDRLQSILRSVL